MHPRLVRFIVDVSSEHMPPVNLPDAVMVVMHQSGPSVHLGAARFQDTITTISRVGGWTLLRKQSVFDTLTSLFASSMDVCLVAHAYPR